MTSCEKERSSSENTALPPSLSPCPQTTTQSSNFRAMGDSLPSHLPADPTPSSSSSRASSNDHHLRQTSTDTTTPLSAALQLEKPPAIPSPPTQKLKKKFHIKTFQEAIEENLAKAEAKAGSKDPWISRKFAIG